MIRKQMARNARWRVRAYITFIAPILVSSLMIVIAPWWGASVGAQGTDMSGGNEADALLREGIAKANAGMVDEAVMLFSRSIQLHKRDPAGYYNRGKVYLIQRKSELAIQDLNQALRLDPKLAGAFEARGLAHKLRGDFVHAVKDFTNAIKIEPASVGALMNRASIFFDAGSPDQALVDLTEVVRIDPGMVKALGNRAAIYEQLGRFEEAVADLTQVLVRDMHNVSAMTHLGSIFAKRGDPKKAARWFRLALIMEPDEAIRNSIKSELQLMERKYLSN